jgi:hypothetical protein
MPCNEEEKYNPFNCNHDCKSGECAFCDERRASLENCRPCSEKEVEQVKAAVKAGSITLPSWMEE